MRRAEEAANAALGQPVNGNGCRVAAPFDAEDASWSASVPGARPRGQARSRAAHHSSRRSFAASGPIGPSSSRTSSR